MFLALFPVCVIYFFFMIKRFALFLNIFLLCAMDVVALYQSVTVLMVKSAEYDHLI